MLCKPKQDNSREWVGYVCVCLCASMHMCEGGVNIPQKILTTFIVGFLELRYHICITSFNPYKTSEW